MQYSITVIVALNIIVVSHKANTRLPISVHLISVKYFNQYPQTAGEVVQI